MKFYGIRGVSKEDSMGRNNSEVCEAEGVEISIIMVKKFEKAREEEDSVTVSVAISSCRAVLKGVRAAVNRSCI